MFIIKHRKIFIIISSLLVLASIISVAVLGLRIGIDFKGGTLVEVLYGGDRPAQSLINESIDAGVFGSVLVQPTGNNGFIIKSRELNEEEHKQLLDILSVGGEYPLEESSLNSIGPSVGRELTRKAIISIVLVIFAIIFFIAFAFRKVSKPVSSWRYGFIAIIALLHDTIIPLGVFSVLSHYSLVEIDTLFVVAILTILGLSVSDTIVIFDRIRENLSVENRHIDKESFGEIVGKSLNQSFTRSLFTSLSTILVLLSLFLFGPSTTQYFALVLIVGMFLGTYSSIFLASPLLVMVANLQKAK